jgi:hypothetical protein
LYSKALRIVALSNFEAKNKQVLWPSKLNTFLDKTRDVPISDESNLAFTAHFST